MSLQITITRGEGPSSQCGKPVTVDSFSKANVLLRSWASTAPAGGGYDKCDFTLIDPTIELEYRGRYDLKHWKVEVADLKAHVVGFLKFQYLGERPPHMSQEQYDRYIASCQHTPETIEEVRQTVEHLENLGTASAACNDSHNSMELDPKPAKKNRP